ncbi:siderophore-interacting protein [Rhodococcus sp. NPDC058521]|uniref:siderophore-interacting protein n=1 Tax=Rhodococcus sp. NPDC058521 TaxID=3346536 RepID=UPI00365B409D
MSRDRHIERIGEVLGGRSGAKVPYPVGMRNLTVLRKEMVGSALLRLTLGGSELEGFESHTADEHVRFVFPDDDGTLRLPEKDGLVLKWPRPMPISREYTVRRYDAESLELDIDFALHKGGFASDWAEAAEPGNRIHVAGPPGGLVVPDAYDRYLLAGDITALPAIARWLEWLPGEASGWAFIEVTDSSEEIALHPPANVEVQWLHRGAAEPGTSDLLEKAVCSVTVPEDERTYAWVAGEATSLKPIRKWIRNELGLAKDDCDIAGYWKKGVADFDEDHEH